MLKHNVVPLNIGAPDEFEAGVEDRIWVGELLLRNALVDAGASEEKADRAAEELTGYNREVADVRGDIAEVRGNVKLLKWMQGATFAGEEIADEAVVLAGEFAQPKARPWYARRLRS